MKYENEKEMPSNQYILGHDNESEEDILIQKEIIQEEVDQLLPETTYHVENNNCDNMENIENQEVQDDQNENNDKMKTKTKTQMKMKLIKKTNKMVKISKTAKIMKVRAMNKEI